MNILAVDDEKPALRMLKDAIEEAVPGVSVVAFLSVDRALAYARQNVVDVAFLDIRMPDIDGMALARCLKEINDRTNIVFVSGYADYALDAFSLPASGYLLKPVSADAVRREMDRLRYPVSPMRHRVWAQTFGNFEIFVEGRPVVFKLSKAKEVLAYLVDRRGAAVRKAELATLLWSQGEYDRNRQIYLQKVIAELVRALKATGAGDVVRRWQGNLAVDVSKIACDYYDFLNGNASAIDAYNGEYMSNYGWAEYTAGTLVERKAQAKM
ncbi:response regulator [Synergistaceae bacterium OttesenSCG-928-I11]|nr:response regulator [Synergistaceae bacterium OttesenSCG-928-I11]